MVKTLIALASSIVSASALAATLTGSFTLPTQYEDGTALPVASIKHIRVEVGTCSASSQFLTAEGSQLVAPPGTAWSITVARAFGQFCARAQTETVSGTLSIWTGTATKTIAEPPPKPPVLLTIGGWVWEVKVNDGLRFVGTIAPGKPCSGLAPQFEPDLFPVERGDVRLEKRPKAGATLLAQCEAS